MKHLVLGFVIIAFSVPTIGCDSGDGGTAGPAAPAAGAPAKGTDVTPKGGPTPPFNPDGPKSDR